MYVVCDIMYTHSHAYTSTQKICVRVYNVTYNIHVLLHNTTRTPVVQKKKTSRKKDAINVDAVGFLPVLEFAQFFFVSDAHVK